MPGVRQRVLAARQDEESHEDRARVLHAQGHRIPAGAVPIAAISGREKVFRKCSPSLPSSQPPVPDWCWRPAVCCAPRPERLHHHHHRRNP